MLELFVLCVKDMRGLKVDRSIYIKQSRGPFQAFIIFYLHLRVFQKNGSGVTEALCGSMQRTNYCWVIGSEYDVIEAQQAGFQFCSRCEEVFNKLDENYNFKIKGTCVL